MSEARALDPVLVVDGANVVGSRPDGWWRDRAGAAVRLHAGLVALVAGTSGDLGRVVLVLEGLARAGVPVGTRGGVVVVHAPGEGDDAIVEAALAAVASGAGTTVVTADRALAERVRRVGALVQRPGWLLRRLDGTGRAT